MLGKSLTLDWNEAWIVHDALSGGVKYFSVASNIKVYVSAERRIFSSLDREAGGGRRRRNVVEKTYYQVSSEKDGLLHWRRQGDALIADQPFSLGARRLVVHFSECALKVSQGTVT